MIHARVCFKSVLIYCSVQNRRAPRKGRSSLYSPFPGAGVGPDTSATNTGHGWALWDSSWLWAESLWREQFRALMWHLSTPMLQSYVIFEAHCTPRPSQHWVRTNVHTAMGCLPQSCTHGPGSLQPGIGHTDNSSSPRYWDYMILPGTGAVPKPPTLGTVLLIGHVVICLVLVFPSTALHSQTKCSSSLSEWNLAQWYSAQSWGSVEGSPLATRNNAKLGQAWFWSQQGPAQSQGCNQKQITFIHISQWHRKMRKYGWG